MSRTYNFILPVCTSSVMYIDTVYWQRTLQENIQTKYNTKSKQRKNTAKQNYPASVACYDTRPPNEVDGPLVTAVLLLCVCVWQWVKPKKIDFEPQRRKKGRNRAGKREQRKQGVIGERKRADVKRSIQQRLKQQQQTGAGTGVLDRFNRTTSWWDDTDQRTVTAGWVVWLGWHSAAHWFSSCQESCSSCVLSDTVKHLNKESVTHWLLPTLHCQTDNCTF